MRINEVGMRGGGRSPFRNSMFRKSWVEFSENRVHVRKNQANFLKGFCNILKILRKEVVISVSRGSTICVLT